jgi:hypothetical protein
MSILDLFREMAENNQLEWQYYDNTTLVLRLIDGIAELNYMEGSHLLSLLYQRQFPVKQSKLSRLYKTLNFLNNEYGNLTFVYDAPSQCLSCRFVIKIHRKKFHKDFEQANDALDSLIESWGQFVPQISQAIKRSHRPLAEVLVNKIPRATHTTDGEVSLH